MKKQNGLYICTYFPTVGVNSHRSSSPVALETYRHKTKISNKYHIQSDYKTYPVSVQFGVFWVFRLMPLLFY